MSRNDLESSLYVILRPSGFMATCVIRAAGAMVEFVGNCGMREAVAVKRGM